MRAERRREEIEKTSVFDDGLEVVGGGGRDSPDSARRERWVERSDEAVRRVMLRVLDEGCGVKDVSRRRRRRLGRHKQRRELARKVVDD
jgi:hypothetical protein